MADEEVGVRMLSERSAVREEYLAAASRLLASSDSHITLVPLRKACSAAGVPIATAYKVWSSQIDFDHDVASLILLRSKPSTPEATFEMVLQSLEGGDSFCEVIRCGVGGNLQMVLEGKSLTTFMSVLPSIDGNDKRRQLLSDHIESHRSVFTHLYRMVLSKFNQKVDPRLGYDDLFNLLNSVVRGFAILQPLIGERSVLIKGRKWNLAAIAAWALVDAVVIGEPAATPFDVMARLERIETVASDESPAACSGKFLSPAERVLSSAADLVRSELQARAERNEPGLLWNLSVRKVLVEAGRSASTSLSPYFADKAEFFGELCGYMLSSAADPTSPERLAVIGRESGPKGELVGGLLRRDYAAFKKSSIRRLVHQFWQGYSGPVLSVELQKALESRIQQSSDLLAHVGGRVGRQMRAGFSDSDLAVILLAVAEGIALHEDLDLAVPSAASNISHPYESAATAIIERLTVSETELG